MDADGKGYISDVDYVPGFYGNMAPIAMSFIAAINRVRPPVGQPSFRYLELGSGLGRCLTTLAAANPNGQFTGVDFNRNHTLLIERDIEAGQLKNAKVITAGFDSLPDDLGEFDFIALHGVYSWVSAAVREDIVKIAKKHLAKQGLLLVSYNAMPGWSALQPIRAILQQYALRRTGDSIQRITEALKYLKYIRDNKAQYFEDNPTVAEKVEMFVQQNPRYLAHEYLNEHWDTFYFFEVADDFKRAGLEFIGSLPPHENFWDLCVRPEFKDLFSTTTDRYVIETHKDFCANTAFRWDVYCREPIAMKSMEGRLESADQFYFRLMRSDIKFPFPVNLGVVTAKAQGPVYEALAVLLATKGMKLSEILAAKDWGSITPLEIVSALDVGACMGIFEVEAASVSLGKTIRPSGKLRLNNEFNRQLLANNILTGRTVSLASEMTGTGHILNDFNAAILHELIERGLPGLAERVTEHVEKSGKELKKAGVKLATHEERVAAIQTICDAFFNTYFQDFVNIGIIEEAV
jgi:ubiquinone/menaquinone biosynthesis C-methylase UbiE